VGGVNTAPVDCNVDWRYAGKSYDWHCAPVQRRSAAPQNAQNCLVTSCIILRCQPKRNRCFWESTFLRVAAIIAHHSAGGGAFSWCGRGKAKAACCSGQETVFSSCAVLYIHQKSTTESVNEENLSSLIRDLLLERD
jgi:hypothetical protein